MFLNDGGMLSRNKRKIRIKAIPSNLPDSIDIDISSMQLGDKITMADIQSDKYEILHPENTVVCQVRTSRASMIIEEPVLETEGEEGEEGVEGAEGAEGAAEGAEGAAEGKKG